MVVCPFTTRGISAELDLEVVVREHTHPYPACTTEELGRLQRVYHGQGADRVPMTMIGRDRRRMLIPDKHRESRLCGNALLRVI